MDIYFLSIREVKSIHLSQILKFGGAHGIRDVGLLDSAVHHPQSSFGGDYLYKDIFQMAAAYAYGIVKNHPFLDGNKRVGSITSILFLVRNGYDLPESDALTQLILDVTTNKASQEDLAKFYKENSTLLFD